MLGSNKRKKISVLQINAVYATKSTGRTCLELDKELTRRGIDSHTAASAMPPHYKNEAFEIGSPLDHKLHALLSRLTGLQGYFSKKATKELISHIKELSPSVVHLRNLHANFINLPLLLGFLAKEDIPTVITLHDCWFFTGKCTHYTSEACYKWKESCGNCPQLRKDNKSWFYDQTSKMLNDKSVLLTNIPRLGVVGVSDWLTEQARKSILKNASIVKRIYNWIDLDAFRDTKSTAEYRRKNGLLSSDFVVLGVASSWGERKGINDFIELASKLKGEAFFFIVGKLDKGVNFPDNVIHIPEINSPEELADVYSSADVFVNLSLEETFGKVTAESLACGTPVVVYDSTANPELVGERCGYIVPPGEVSAVAQFLLKVKGRGREYYSESCREFAKENFCMKGRVCDYVSLYRELVNERS